MGYQFRMLLIFIEGYSLGQSLGPKGETKVGSSDRLSVGNANIRLEGSSLESSLEG